MSKRILATIGVLTLSLMACEKKADLKSDKGKYSYAIGHQIGRNIKNQSIDLDHVAFAAAVKDTLDGKKTQLTDEQMREALKVMSELRNKQKKAEAEENKKKADAFLEANAKKEGFKTTKSGLQYLVMKEGKGTSPSPEDIVKVHYKGMLIDGKEFDSSYKRNKPAEFPVKAVIPGWTEALQLMKAGAKYQLVIPPNLAYGERGNPSIPGNSVLIFEVELLDIKKGKKK